jgi:diguanylate cyclase (GGDEF)-like protein
MVTLGRAAECNASFDDQSLSREHARVMLVNDVWIIRDAGSRNGTFVNDVRIEKAVAMRDGDRIQLGSDTVLRFSLVTEREEEDLKRVYAAASLDGLTGVLNRKALDERLDAELAYAVRHDTPLSVIILDVDHFKRVNDTHGHPAGDAVLRSIASCIAQSLRAEDAVGRYGGEEFVIVARGLEAEHAVQLADRTRHFVEQTPTQLPEGPIYVTASAGVAALSCCGEARDTASLVAIADRRLYEAKQSGRNRVVGP